MTPRGFKSHSPRLVAMGVAALFAALFARSASTQTVPPSPGPAAVRETRSTTARQADGAAGTSPQGEAYVHAPMRDWMRGNLVESVQERSFPVIADALRTTARFAPGKEYPYWESISLDGASAADRRDFAATQASCRSCHAQYMQKYRLQDSTRDLTP